MQFGAIRCSNAICMQHFAMGGYNCLAELLGKRADLHYALWQKFRVIFLKVVCASFRITTSPCIHNRNCLVNFYFILTTVLVVFNLVLVRGNYTFRLVFILYDIYVFLYFIFFFTWTFTDSGSRAIKFQLIMYHASCSIHSCRNIDSLSALLVLMLE